MSWGIAQQKAERCAACSHERKEHRSDGECLHELCSCRQYLPEVPPLDPDVRPPDEELP